MVVVVVVRSEMDTGMNFKYVPMYHLVFIFRTGLQHPTAVDNDAMQLTKRA